MTEPLPPAPPLRCMVVAWTLDPNTADPAWVIIFANGDEGLARQRAAEWLERNPEGEVQLMIAQPEGRARRVARVEWGPAMAEQQVRVIPGFSAAMGLERAKP